MGNTCKGKTRRGTPCKRPAGPSGFCYQHDARDVPDVHGDGLTDRQRAFVHHYIQCGFNGAEAARLAGYEEVSARVCAARLLTNDNIQRVIQEHFQQSAMGTAEVLARIAALARGTLASFLRPGINDDVLRIDLTSAEAVAALHTLRKVKTRTRRDESGAELEEVSVEMYSSLDALKILLTHLQPSVTRLEHSGVDGAPIEMAGGFTLDVSALSDDALAELEDALLENDD